MRKILLIVSLLMVLSATPALAVKNGTLDGERAILMVGLMVAAVTVQRQSALALQWYAHQLPLST